MSHPSVSVLLLPVPAPAGDVALAAVTAALTGHPAELLVLAPGGGQAPGAARAVPVEPAAGRGAWLAAGAAAASGEVLVLLHADALPRPGFLPPLLEALARDGVGLAASRIVDLAGRDPSDGLILTYGRPWPLGVAPHGDSTANAGRRAALEVAAAPDVALAIRADRLAALGGADPAFRGGGAAVDLCLRAGEAGLRTLVARRSVVAHDPRYQAARGDEPLLSRRWIGRVPLFDAERLHQPPARPPRPGRTPVSVVVPAAQAVERLPRFLEGLLATLGPQDELLVADAASDDGTAEYVEVLGRDARPAVRLVTGPAGHGLPGALGAGLAAARRPFAAVLHPAAAAPPELLDEVTRFLESQAQFSVLAFPVRPTGLVACGRTEVLRAVGASQPGAFFDPAGASLEAAAAAAGGRVRLLAGG